MAFPITTPWKRYQPGLRRDHTIIEPLSQVEKEILEKARKAIVDHVDDKNIENEIDRIQLLMLRDYLIKQEKVRKS